MPFDELLNESIDNLHILLHVISDFKFTYFGDKLLQSYS